MKWLPTSVRFGVALTILLSVLPAKSQSRNWWDDDIWRQPERGFNWYPPDPPKPAASAASRPTPKPSAQPAANIKDLDSIAKVRAELARLRDVAILKPTSENLLAYLEANQYVMDKSAYFADMWRRVVWANPSVDYNARFPAATFAQTAIKEERDRTTDELLALLAKTHGLLFFFRSDCQYCHIQAPVLRMLADRYGVEVLPISMDGGPMPGLPTAKPDNGISRVVTQGQGIDTVPSLFLVSRDQREVIALGAGVLAMDEIVERVRVLLSTKPGQSY